MKMLKFSVHEEMLFALLRASLNQRDIETGFFQGVSSVDWKECYQLSVRQGVMALAWDGVLRLPAALMPPKGLKITWGMAVEVYEKKYERYCQVVEELITCYQEHGISTVQLKGVGLSTYYPVPCHREGGDIDIYTYSMNKERMSDLEANGLADKLMEEQGIEVDRLSLKHSNFYYKGIPIENHKTLLDVNWYNIAPQVERILQGIMNPQSVCLMGDKYKCTIPSEEFNQLFVVFHAAQHCGFGLALHHLCDWAVLLNRYGLQLPDEIADKKFLRFVTTLTYLCNQLLGTSIPDMKPTGLAKDIFDDMLHPKYEIETVPVKGKLNIVCYKARRFVHKHSLNNQALEWPIWKRICDMISKKVHHPETIFRTFTE